VAALYDAIRSLEEKRRIKGLKDHGTMDKPYNRDSE